MPLFVLTEENVTLPTLSLRHSLKLILEIKPFLLEEIVIIYYLDAVRKLQRDVCENMFTWKLVRVCLRKRNNTKRGFSP